MEQYTVQEAQTRLRELMTAALQGETVLISGENGEMVRLAPVHPFSPGKRRQAGSARGLIRIADDFDAPLTDFGDYME